ncbi:MAG: hypothetical protein HOE90_14185 [Bacteriovoracaceae bacterium]|nr:hypothetical protein [Bacteriovoracaceae bacterium]
MATVAVLEGKAWLIRDGFIYHLDQGIRLGKSDIIKTLKGSYVKLVTEEDAVINMSEYSHLRVDGKKEFFLPYGMYRIHQTKRVISWFKTPDSLINVFRGQIAIDVFKYGAYLKTNLGVIGGRISLTPIENNSKDKSYFIDRGALYQSDLFLSKGIGGAVSKLEHGIRSKLYKDRMIRYKGLFLFPQLFPEDTFPYTHGPEYKKRPRFSSKIKKGKDERYFLKQRDRRFQIDRFGDDTLDTGNIHSFYRPGIKEMDINLTVYKRPRQIIKEKFIDDVFQREQVRSQGHLHHRKVIENKITPKTTTDYY